MLWTPIRILYQHPRCLVGQQKNIPTGVDQKGHTLHSGHIVSTSDGTDFAFHESAD